VKIGGAALGPERGFTLTDLMVSMVCMLMVGAVLFSAFGSQMWTGGKEQRILDLQMNSRTTLDRLSWLFRHAGYGCKDSFPTRTITGTDPDGPAITINSILAGIVDNPALTPDEVIVVTGFKKVAEVNGSQASTANVLLKNLDTPAISDVATEFKRFLTFSPYPENVFFEVADDNNPFGLDRAVSQVPDNADVYMVTPIRVRVRAADGALLLQNFAYASAPAPDQFWEVAEGIEDLQFEYTTDNGATWIGSPPAPGAVQGVRISLLVRSLVPDMKHTDIKTYTVAGQVVGPFNDHFHRQLSTTTVWLRN